MKWKAVIVLLAISFTIFAPPSLPLTAAHDGHSRIGSLDICHSAIPAISANGEMPCITPGPAVHCPTIFIALTASQKPFFLQPLFTFDSEHPPKA